MYDTPSAFRWSDHPGKIAVGSPLLMAAVSTAVAVIDFLHLFDPLLSPFTSWVLVFNGAVAAAGSAAGGSLVAGSTGTRAGVALIGAVFGFTLYFLCFQIFAALAGVVMRAF